MKQTRLLRTLLAAVCLFVGTSAWAGTKILYSQDYENATDVSSWTWTTGNAYTVSLETNGGVGYGNYIKCETSNASGNRSAYTGFYTTGNDFYSDYTAYTIEFDAAIKMGNTASKPTDLVVASEGFGYQFNQSFAAKNTSNNNFLFKLSNASDAAAYSTTYYINNGTTSCTIASDAWFHVKLDVDIANSEVSYSLSGAVTTSGTYTITDNSSLKAQAIFAGLNKGYYSKVWIDNISITTETEEDVADVPTLALTGFNGTSRIFTVSCNSAETIHYQVKDGDTEKQSGTGVSAGASVEVTVPAGQKLIAWTTSGTATSSNAEITVTGGTPVLTAPTVTMSDIGADYEKSYTVSNLTQTITEGVYSYNFQPSNVFYATSSTATSGTTISNNKFTLTEAGTYYVIVYDAGTTPASIQVNNTINYLKSATYDFTKSSILTDVWTDATGTEKWAATGDEEAYKENAINTASSTELFDGFTVSDAGSRLNKIHWHNGKGIQFVNGSGNFSIALTTLPENAIVRNTYYQDALYHTILGNTITIGRYNKTTEKQGLVSIEVYIPDPIAFAIADCKAFETSAAFATAMDAVSFSTADEVYAFHTAWQIAQAEAASSNDITKVIRNAAITSTTDWVGSRVIELSTEKYDGAPDNFLIDANNQEMDTYQMLYGLPAGNYIIKAATRANEGVTTGKIYVYADGQVDKNAEGNHIGNQNGDLGHGWSWTSIDFELTSTSDVKIGYYVDAKGSGKWASCDDWHLYKLPESVSATITPTGYATFSSPYALDFSNKIENLEGAYYASAVETGKVTMTKLEQTVPAETGLFLKGTAGETVTIPVVASGTDINGTNFLKPNTSESTVTASTENAYHYVFAYTTSDGSNPGFFNLGNNVTLGAGKAYIETETSIKPTGGAKVSILFTDTELTGIVNAEANDTTNAKTGKIYNIAGQVVTESYKGIKIIDGKKVF